MRKGTVNDKVLNLWQPIVKTEGGKFIAILSDDSVDRDGEIVGKEALLKIKDDNTYLAALMDHENKVLNMVGEWVERRVETIIVNDKQHHALISEPRFFESNSKAREIKGMLEEGAKMGVSIGAIVKDKTTKEVDGEERTLFTDLELVEASFVAVPANRHAQAIAVAKSYEKNKEMEVNKVTEEKIEELNKKLEDLESSKKESDSELTTVKTELEEAKKELEKAEEAKKQVAEMIKSLDKANSELADTKKELDETTKEFEKLKASPLLKAEGDAGGEGGEPENPEEDADKALKEGKIPIIRR